MTELDELPRIGATETPSPLDEEDDAMLNPALEAELEP